MKSIVENKGVRTKNIINSNEWKCLSIYIDCCNPDKCYLKLENINNMYFHSDILHNDYYVVISINNLLWEMGYINNIIKEYYKKDIVITMEYKDGDVNQLIYTGKVEDIYGDNRSTKINLVCSLSLMEKGSWIERLKRIVNEADRVNEKGEDWYERYCRYCIQG